MLIKSKRWLTLPSREGLLSMLLSVLQAPMRNFALAVKAVAEKKEGKARNRTDDNRIASIQINYQL